jgi:hypothetical protein
MATTWYQISASKLGSDEIRTGQVNVESISNVIHALGKYGWHVHRYYEVDRPKNHTTNPFLGKKHGEV